MPYQIPYHRPARWQPARDKDDRPSAARRGYNRRWRRLRKMILAREPICRMCQRAPAEHVDHIVPLGKGGTNDPKNLQGLCAACHNRKTAAERDS